MFCSSRLAFVSHSIDIYTVAIKNIRNIHAFSTNQIAGISHFTDNVSYAICNRLYFHTRTCSIDTRGVNPRTTWNNTLAELKWGRVSSQNKWLGLKWTD